MHINILPNAKPILRYNNLPFIYKNQNGCWYSISQVFKKRPNSPFELSWKEAIHQSKHYTNTKVVKGGPDSQGTLKLVFVP